MRKSCFGTVLLLCLIVIPAFAEEFTFRSTGGLELTAEIVEVSDESVTIRRPSDGVSLVMPLSSLDEQTRTELLAMREAKGDGQNDSAAGNWKRVEIVLPQPMDSVAVTGVFDKMDMLGGAREHTMILPVGSWVNLFIRTQQQRLEASVQFTGEASRWEVGSHGTKITLRKDRGPEKIVSVTLDEDLEPEQWFAGTQLPYADSISLELKKPGQLPVAKSLSPVPISSLVDRGEDVTDAELAEVARAGAKAVSINPDYALMPSLAHFAGTDLECLSFGFFNQPSVSNGKKLADYPVDLPDLPDLKHMGVSFLVVPGDFGESLCRNAPRLRTLMVSARSPKAPFSEFKGLERLPDLEVLNLPWGVKTTVEELKKLKKLRFFGCDNGGLIKGRGQYQDFPTLTGLLGFRTTMLGFPPQHMQDWSANGNMKSIVSLETFRAFDFSYLRDAELVFLRRHNKSQDRYDLPALGSLSRLAHVKLNNATQGEVEALGRLPNASQIEGLELYRGTYVDLSPLKSMVNLRRLEISRGTGGLSRIHLTQFPKLKRLVVSYHDNLWEITGLPMHPSLEYVSLISCPRLQLPHEPITIGSLRAFKLDKMDQVTDLSFLQDRDISQLKLRYCDGLAEPLGIDLDSIDYCEVYNCDGLESREPEE